MRYPLTTLATSIVTSLGLALTLSTSTLAQGVTTQPPNAPSQEPAFPEQTRAPLPDSQPQVETSVVASDLPQLWAMEFLPDGRMLVTAKEGRMFVIGPDGAVGPDISGLPEVDARGQGGLLDVALAPDFESSSRIFFSFSEPRDAGNGTSVASAVLTINEAGEGELSELAVLFRQTPGYDGNKHFGSRLVFSPEGNLYVTVDERSDAAVRTQAQDVGSGLGKVFRIDQNGDALPDNPLVGVEGAQPEIWSLGHRNMQSATLGPDGRLWTVEHGPRGGDELNQPQAGKNYGWPEVTYGIEYSGQAVGEGITSSEGVTQPVYYWDPVIAPSGMALYTGEAFPTWQNAFLIGGLVAQGLVVLHLEDDVVVAEERVPLGARVRDVRVGPDDAVYVVTEQRGAGSSILRLSNAG